jgi:anthranilate phosphoribosyltransferase
MIRIALERLIDGHDLTRDDARTVMAAVMDGETTPAQISGLLVALRAKGETSDEIAGFADAMRERVVVVSPTRTPVIDVVGTGGDGANTFNISTAAAIVAAAAGAAVAKHGNRAASSACGAADVLEALGFDLEQPPEQIAASIDELGFGFMFARSHHPAMRHAAPVRQELGVRTVFNLLGPLSNPAGARDGVFGVATPSLARTYAEALAALGSRRAFVVHGDGGIDELSPGGPNLVVEVVDGEISEWELDPRSLGVYPSDPADLAGGGAKQNAEMLIRLFDGEPGARRDAALLNAAAALVAAGIADDLPDGWAHAEGALDSGLAAARLGELVSFSAERAR